MDTAYLLVTILFAAMAAFSAVAKIRRDAKVVHVIQEVVGVPLRFFPLLAACELAGALGLVLGIWSPWVGVAAGIGLVIYFVGAVASHLRVGDVKGMRSEERRVGKECRDWWARDEDIKKDDQR